MRSPGEGGDPGGVQEPADDDTIRRLLRSDKEDEVWRGIVALDRRYRYEIGEWLRRNNGRLPSADLPVIWNAVLLAVHVMAGRDKIAARGELSKLLHTIAKRKAADCRRQANRSRIDGGADVAELAIDRCDGPHELRELIEAIRTAIRSLTDTERKVFTIRLDFFLETSCPPSLEELTDLFNRSTKQSVSPESIKGHLQRGRPKLRAQLESGGLWP